MKETTKAWMKFAKSDFKVKELLLDGEEMELIFAFHCQQAIEKLFKAILVENDILPPKIHDLQRLFYLLPENIKNQLSNSLLELDTLSVIYVDSRYPSDYVLLPNAFISKEDLVRINVSTNNLYNTLLTLLTNN
jgi:HEPN domain-containing protein